MCPSASGGCPLVEEGVSKNLFAVAGIGGESGPPSMQYHTAQKMLIANKVSFSVTELSGHVQGWSVIFSY